MIAALPACASRAQTAANVVALRGLAPFGLLRNTDQGRAALSANYVVTGAIQTGVAKQPILASFPLQQEQALKDAFITGWDVEDLADGLGTALGAAYRSAAHYTSSGDFTNVSPAVANLIAYTNETTASDSSVAKYVFANGTTDGTTPVSAAVAGFISSHGGQADIFGKAYGLEAGAVGADRYGDSRPYLTEPRLTVFAGTDFFGKASTSVAFLKGPAANLLDSPSFPSGHTTYGYMGSLLLALMIPQRYQQEITRGAEFGNDRIILGAHYAMDVIAGRTLALHDVAHLLANDPRYVGQPKRRAGVITDYQAALRLARSDVARVLEAGCGQAGLAGGLAACADQDTGRFSHVAANEALYESTQTYGLPVVYASMAARTEDVRKIAPEAGYLLTAAFPRLTLSQADAILTATEGPGGGFLDNGSEFGLYSRLDLYAAAGRAAVARVAPTRSRR